MQDLTESKVDCKQNFDCGSLEGGFAPVRLFAMAKTKGRVRYFKERRKAKGLTLDQLSERSGLSVSMLSLLERGKRDYSEETLFGLAEALGCEVGELFTPPGAHRNELAEYLMKLDAKEQGRALRTIRAMFDDDIGDSVQGKKKA